MHKKWFAPSAQSHALQPTAEAYHGYIAASIIKDFRRDLPPTQNGPNAIARAAAHFICLPR
jgi:hypothetical protein